MSHLSNSTASLPSAAAVMAQGPASAGSDPMTRRASVLNIRVPLPPSELGTAPATAPASPATGPSAAPAGQREQAGAEVGRRSSGAEEELQTPSYSADSQRVLEQRINSGHFIRKFNLPPDTTLIYDCLCMLYRNALPIQGRLYLAYTHLCFYSKIFGSETKEVLALHDITAISKRGLGLIEVNTTSESREKLLFAGFLSRDKTYQMIISAWEKCLGNAPHPPAAAAAAAAPAAAQDKSSGPPSPSPADEASPGGSPGPVQAEETPGEDLLLSEVEDTGTSGFLEVSSLTELCKAEFDCSVIKFFKVFFSDASKGFWGVYHNERQDKDVYTGAWQSHPQFGNVRDKRYIVIIKGSPFGPPTSRLEETQRYSLTKTHLVVESVGTTLDIPFGDCFRVELKYNVNQGATPTSCTLSISLGCRWIKRTMLKGKIESITIKQSTESFKRWIELAKAHLATQTTNLASSNPVAPSPSRTSTPGAQVIQQSSSGSLPTAAAAAAVPQPIVLAPPKAPEPESMVGTILDTLGGVVGALGGAIGADGLRFAFLVVVVAAFYYRLLVIEDLLRKNLTK
eukprot:m51a1_g6665 putative C-tail anchored protein (569) ;mRNA; r:175898-178095